MSEEELKKISDGLTGIIAALDVISYTADAIDEHRDQAVAASEVIADAIYAVADAIDGLSQAVTHVNSGEVYAEEEKDNPLIEASEESNS